MRVIKLGTVARKGWLRGGSAGRGSRGAGCSYRPAALPPAWLSFRARVAQTASSATRLRHTLDSQFDHHHADRARSGLGDAVLLPLMPGTSSTCRLGTPLPRTNSPSSSQNRRRCCYSCCGDKRPTFIIWLEMVNEF